MPDHSRRTHLPGESAVSILLVSPAGAPYLRLFHLVTRASMTLARLPMWACLACSVMAAASVAVALLGLLGAGITIMGARYASAEGSFFIKFNGETSACSHQPQDNILQSKGKIKQSKGSIQWVQELKRSMQHVGAYACVLITITNVKPKPEQCKLRHTGRYHGRVHSRPPSPVGSG